MACNPDGAYERRKQQYFKILLVNDMSCDIAAFGESQGSEKLAERTDLNCGAVPVGDFEQVIDQEAAHQFLELYMNIAEHRFAYAVTELLKLNPLYMTALKNYCHDKGSAIKPEQIAGADGAYKILDMCILDGMPCDETKSIISRDENKLIWKKNIDTHERFWVKAGGNVDIYYELQTSFIQGILEGSDLEFTNENNEIFCLKNKKV